MTTQSPAPKPSQPPTARDDGRVASLEVAHVSVVYPNGTVALKDASFALEPGTIAGLVGINGAGKSTLFKAIMGFVTPSSGHVTIAGLPARQAQRANLVAYVPQSEDVDWDFPVLVEDVVMMGRYGHMGLAADGHREPTAPRSTKRSSASAWSPIASARSANSRAARESASSWRARWLRKAW